jgi:hypothetical protein
MKASKHDPTLFQLPVPDKKIERVGEFRTVSGEAMEEVIFALFSLLPGIPNGMAKVCPDAYTPAEKPVEIKSLKVSQKLPLYKFRLEKDDPETIYFIGIHKRDKSEGLKDMWEKLAKTMQQVFIVPHSIIAEIVKDLPLNTIKSNRTKSGKRNGYQRKGYKDGYYNVPYRLLKERLAALPFLVSCTLHGLQFKVQVYIHPSLCSNVATK